MKTLRVMTLLGLFLSTMTLAVPARAEWLRAETDHFIIYGDSSERAITNYARKLETFDALLRAYYPIPIDYEVPKLEIFMADGRDDMLQAAPGISPNIAGFYTPNAARIHVVANVGAPDSDDTIFHEYSHHFMFQMLSDRASYPAWFVEGFAEYYATVRIRSDNIQIGRPDPGRMNSLTQPANSWPPMEDVLDWRVSSSGRYRGADYYAISWALTHYMLATPERTRQLGRYLSAFAAGESSVDAMTAATDRSPRELLDEVRRYMSGAIQYYTPQIDLPQPVVSVSRLPPDEAELIWINLRLDTTLPGEREPSPAQRPGEPDQAFAIRQAETLEAWRTRRDQLIADAAQAATRCPTSQWGRLVKAKGERLAGRPADAIETLRPIAGPDAESAEALRLYASAVMDVLAQSPEGVDVERLRADARGALSQSLDIDPLAFQTYLAIDRLRQGSGGYPNENDASTLQVAVTLAPQSFDARLRYARVLLAQNNPVAAINVLLPVANSPHGGTARAAGRALLTQALEAAGRTATDPSSAVDVPEDSVDEAGA